MGCSACHGIVDAQHQCLPLRTALRRRIARRPTAQFGQRHETIERCELRAAARKTSDLKAQGDASLEIGRAHVCTPVTNAHLVCRLLLAKKKHAQSITSRTLTHTFSYTLTRVDGTYP